jgi:hypothetical protein
MTNTTSTFGARRGTRRVPTQALPDLNRSFSANRSVALILMNEALSRARLLVAPQARTRLAPTRPARLIAMSAAKRRERLGR